MSPILGIYASSMQPALNATSYESIATVTVGAGGSSSITFSSIPSTYKHLQIRCLTVSTSVSSGATLQFNSDTSTNYRTHSVYGSGAATGTSSETNILYAPYFMGGAATTSPGASIIDILDYTDTNKNKTVRSLTGYDANGSGYITLSSGLWFATPAAVTSIKISLTTISQYSSFALYGIKA